MSSQTLAFAGSPAIGPSTKRQYSIGEEIANSVSHGIGCALAVSALTLLIVSAATHGSGLHLAAALLMGIPLVCEYLCSTLYHAIQRPSVKSVLRIIDHSAIYLLIAGSYAPFALITLADRGGTRLFALVCALAVAGVVAEAIWQERQSKWLTIALYLAMGWTIAFHIADLVQLLPSPAFWLLLAGGLSYSIGTAFYVMKKLPYTHFVFHLFVLAGSICITLSALLYVV